MATPRGTPVEPEVSLTAAIPGSTRVPADATGRAKRKSSAEDGHATEHSSTALAPNIVTMRRRS